MTKKQPGTEPGETRVVVLVEETGGNTVRVESTHPSKASAIITALDRTFAAYSDDIETETRTWVGLADGLFSAFRHAFKLPSAKTVMSRHQRDVQLDERAIALDQRELAVIQRDHDVSTRETIAEENRRALDARADELAERESRPIAVTGESVEVPLDGPVTVRVNINGLVYTYTETDVSRELVDPANVKAVLTYHANAWNWDTATGLPDRQVAERILDYVSGLISMNAEIKGTGNVLPEDLETPEPAEVRTFHDDGVPVLNLDDAEPTVGTSPLGGEAVKELIRKRDRNLAGT